MKFNINEAKIAAVILMDGSNGVLQCSVTKLANEAGMDRKQIYRMMDGNSKLFTITNNEANGIELRLVTAINPDSKGVEVSNVSVSTIEVAEVEVEVEVEVIEEVRQDIPLIPVTVEVEVRQDPAPKKDEPVDKLKAIQAEVMKQEWDVTKQRLKAIEERKKASQEAKAAGIQQEIHYFKNMILDAVEGCDTSYQKMQDSGKYCHLVNVAKRKGWTIQDIQENCTVTYSMLERMDKLEQFDIDVNRRIKRGGEIA